jgi:hypothetical protein
MLFLMKSEMKRLLPGQSTLRVSAVERQVTSF